MENLLSLSIIICHYHRNRIAFAICERCRRPICLEDKRILIKDYSYFEHNNSNYHSYCLICFGVQLEKTTITYEYLIIEIFSFLIIFILGIDLTNIFVPIFIITVFFAYNSNKRIQLARSDIYQFKMHLYTSKDTIINPSFNFPKYANAGKENSSTNILKALKVTNVLYSIVCYECGNQIQSKFDFCSNCGYRSPDELISLYKIHEIPN